MTQSVDLDRFGGINRLYGVGALDVLARSHIMIAGIGGVGSWTAEALARSGVGKITLIDQDDICITNTNRQIHALDGTVGQLKTEVMLDRIQAINPVCDVQSIDQFLTLENLNELVDEQCDMFIDAIDAAMVKAHLIAHCKRRKIPIITVGSAGGQTDPRLITSTDLSKTVNDPLAAKVRGTLRNRFNFSRNLKRRFGIECIYSEEHLAYPQPDGSVGGNKFITDGKTRMDCSAGFGAATMVTGTFGFIAASRAIDKILAKAARQVKP